MTKEELRKLVDQGRGLKEKIDSFEVELGKIKKVLSQEAKTRKIYYLLGNKHFCRVSPMTGTECEPTDLYDTFRELKRGVEVVEWV